MKILLLVFALLFSTLILFSCKNTLSPGDQTLLNLTLEEVSCTEAWIKLSTSDLFLPAKVELQQNGNLYKSINLFSADTIIYVDSLLPNKNYSFRSIIQTYNQSIKSSALQFSTLDTTSHNFNWQTFTFGGQAGSCELYYVAIVDENNIWVVGEIYMLDSAGIFDPNAYNAVHWDGNQWKLERIGFYSSCNDVEFPPLQAVWAFSQSNILLTNGGSIGRFNGNTVTVDCRINQLLTGMIKCLWGKNNDDLYAVGYNGNITHYLNGEWMRINSNTDAFINDVWGVTNPDDNKTEVYCAVSFIFQYGDRKIISIDDNGKVDSIKWMQDRRVNSIWTNNSNFIYAAGDGLFNNKNGQWREESDLPNYYIRRVRGTALNDIYIVGDFGFFAHYSGTTWQCYPELSINGAYVALDVKNDIVVISGYKNQQAIIVVGSKN